MVSYGRDRLLVLGLRVGVVQREHHVPQRSPEPTGLYRFQDGDFAGREDQCDMVLGGHYQYFVSPAGKVPARDNMVIWFTPPPHEPSRRPVATPPGVTRWYRRSLAS